ncbi:ATP-binding cassette domain-containing protein [Candidatus Zixiibacteriota bacterium]
MATAAAIAVDGLSRSFADLVAVDRLTFSVKRGELFGLVGPDGAGKTTTLRMLAGVLRPDSGEAIVGQTSVVLHPETVKHDIAYMPQRFGLYVDLTVIENIEFYADLYRVPRAERPARLERLFAFSNLGPFQNRLAGALSGGMKQKLGLCCALIHQPEILLLDEPTFGVDPISRRDLWLIIHEMVGRGTTVVVSTSYMDETERFDRVALLHDGHLKAVDTPAKLQQSIGGEILVIHTADVRQARDIAGSLTGVRGATIFGDTVHVLVDSTAEMKSLIEEQLAAAGCGVTDIITTAPSMEDVFISYMAQHEGERDG